MSVAAIKLTVESAQRLIRRLANSGAPMRIVANSDGARCQANVDHVQVRRCIQDGALDSKPSIDEFGNLTCAVRRHGAGEPMRVTVVVALAPNGTQELIVTGVEVIPLAH